MNACPQRPDAIFRTGIPRRALFAMLLLSVTFSTRAEDPAQPALTPAERAWIAAHPVVLMTGDPAWPPFSFIDKQGRQAGIDADFLALVAARTGLRFELVQTRTWAEAEELGNQRKVRLLTGMASLPERAAHFDFSEPYMKAPVAVIMREDAPFWMGLHSLEGRRVASPRGYAPTIQLHRDFPQLQIVETENARQGLVAASRGEVDAVVENLVVATHTIKKAGLTNLKISGLLDDRFELRLAVPKGEAELLGILNKTIASISEREVFAIQDRWINVNAEDAINWRLVRRLSLWAAGLLALFAAGFIAWNRRLARELAERRRVETALRASDEELRAANRRQAALIEEKKVLIGIAAHDLRNPLAAIIGASELLALTPGQPADPQTIEIIQTAGLRMSRLVKNLLLSEALENGPAVVHPAKVELAAIVTGIVAQHRSRAREKKIALAWEPPAAPVRVLADVGAVEQIIDNLISNALKFTPATGSVKVRLTAGEKHAHLAIEDSGPGIPPAEQPRLFARYSRLSTLPTAGESSHGLGLLIVQRFAEAMHGAVRYESSPLGGSRFVVDLPLATGG